MSSKIEQSRVLSSIQFMVKVLTQILRSFGNLLYPPTCLHCQTGLYQDRDMFCHECSFLLELIDPQERCPYCFSELENPEKHICAFCYKNPPLLNRIASAFDYIGPPATLIRKLKYANVSYLAKGAGAFLAAQFLTLEWPMPDWIIPVPLPFMRKFERGYNQSLLLAQSVSQILNVPIIETLKRRSDDLSQAGLDRTQRLRLTGETFYLKNKKPLQDRRLLLIDDVMTTGSTLRKCAETLLEAYPSEIYGLTVCRAIT